MFTMLDRLLEEWDTFTQQYRDPEKRASRFGPFSLAEIKALFRQALVFDITNVNDFVLEAKGGVLTESDFPNAMPVAPVMWLEWTDPQVMPLTFLSGKPVPRTGVLSYGALIVTTHVGDDGHTENFLLGFTFQEHGTTLFGGAYAYKCGPDGTPLAVKAVSADIAHLEQADPERFRSMMRCYLGTSFMAISFMHCKNVITKRTETPKRKASATTSGKRKAPYVRCHTLLIEPMKQVLRTEGQIETTGIKQALHLCRGHFKDYSKGKGLFGKVKGLFWWDMHTRGNAEVGVVLKDYKVDAPVH